MRLLYSLTVFLPSAAFPFLVKLEFAGVTNLSVSFADSSP